MKDIVVLSGKGGTGKTSLTASLALLAENPVIVDGDVDAADLHLILDPEIDQQHDFFSGHEATIREKDCTACGACVTLCRFNAVKEKKKLFGKNTYAIDPYSCEGCGVCARFCPYDAIDLSPRLCGKWMISKTRAGPMVHAHLGVGGENSGQLVTLVRQKAKQIAQEKGHNLILLDGPPGIGCPVIASLSGADLALIVTEPSLSGAHDLSRLLKLTQHFGIQTALCVNKWDICPEMTAQIEKEATAQDVLLLGRMRYDEAVTQAQVQAKAIIETEAPSAEDVHKLWENLKEKIT
ncbi:MAG TPA: (4Fe-4S)-binding protein [Rhodospirillaceae bacterium]|nr:(4Fe-4S)-binding protein [Rhodospirillaceae bacterium]